MKNKLLILLLGLCSPSLLWAQWDYQYDMGTWSTQKYANNIHVDGAQVTSVSNEYASSPNGMRLHLADQVSGGGIFSYQFIHAHEPEVYAVTRSGNDFYMVGNIGKYASSLLGDGLIVKFDGSTSQTRRIVTNNSLPSTSVDEELIDVINLSATRFLAVGKEVHLGGNFPIAVCFDNNLNVIYTNKYNLPGHVFHQSFFSASGNVAILGSAPGNRLFILEIDPTLGSVAGLQYFVLPYTIGGDASFVEDGTHTVISATVIGPGDYRMIHAFRVAKVGGTYNLLWSKLYNFGSETSSVQVTSGNSPTHIVFNYNDPVAPYHNRVGIMNLLPHGALIGAELFVNTAQPIEQRMASGAVQQGNDVYIAAYNRSTSLRTLFNIKYDGGMTNCSRLAVSPTVTNIPCMLVTGSTNIASNYFNMTTIAIPGTNTGGVQRECDGTMVGAFKKSVSTENVVNTDQPVSIYPTVSEGKYQVTGLDKISRLNVYSLQGRLVKSMRKLSAAELDLSELANGTYLVQIDMGDQSKTIKLIKQ